MRDCVTSLVFPRRRPPARDAKNQAGDESEARIAMKMFCFVRAGHQLIRSGDSERHKKANAFLKLMTPKESNVAFEVRTRLLRMFKIRN